LTTLSGRRGAAFGAIKVGRRAVSSSTAAWDECRLSFQQGQPSGARRQLIALAEVLALRFPLLENGQLPSQDALGVVGATESEERHGMRDVGGRRDEAHISGPGFVALRTEPKFRRDGLLRTVATEQRIAYVCVQGVLPGAPIGRSSFDNAFAPPRWVTRESPGASRRPWSKPISTWRDVLA